MTEPHPTADRRWAVGLGILLVIGGISTATRLNAPLLEGAAGKQTHTAMVARNLYRDRATFTRPRVDDVGKPGYFIKELPILAGGASLIYEASGVDDRILRLLTAAAWLLALPALAFLTREDLGIRGSLVAGLWYVVSPMAATYGPSAMTDPLAVASSLGALAAVARWRREPSLVAAGTCAVLVGLAALLKPHTAFWLGPAALFLTFASGPGAPRPRPGDVAALAIPTAFGLAAAAAWYLHAASIHRDYPVPGATVAAGWTDISLLAAPALYMEIARQLGEMVFTPVGLAVAALGLLRGRPLGATEKALLLWGGGVLIQCLVFAPRMFDGLSRGTEYYQLALVPTAAVLIARGVESLAALARAPRRQTVTVALVLVALTLGAARETRTATRIPARYANLLSDCEKVKKVTRPEDEFLVFADRGGTVLYYCDRRGLVLTRAGESSKTTSAGNAAVAPAEVSRAMREARFVYLPFPDADAELPSSLAESWHEVPLPDSSARLFENPARRPGGAVR